MTEPGTAENGLLTGSGYWNERLENAWGPHGVGSLAYGRNYNSWLYRVRRHAFLDVCRKLDMSLSTADVLDVGCGTGFYVDQWLALGVKSLTGLDFAPVAIKRLRGSHPEIRFCEADIGTEPSPVDADQFDIVSALDVLFHIVDDRHYGNALRNIHRALRQDGYLLYSDAFVQGATQQYMDYWKARSLWAIEQHLDDIGFEILSRTPVFVLMNSPVDTRIPGYKRIWDLAMKAVARSETVGFLAGAGLYPIELLLRKLIKEGPSTEIMLCRKR